MRGTWILGIFPPEIDAQVLVYNPSSQGAFMLVMQYEPEDGGFFIEINHGEPRWLPEEVSWTRLPNPPR